MTGEGASEAMDLSRPGRFVVGCNYWASHAGTAMWRQWRPEVVERDLRLLREQGVRVLRVFPLWPDFQPISALRDSQRIVEYRHGEEPLPDDELGRAGVSRQAVDRFRALADLAQERGIGLVVGLVTGWMSGRLFVPPGLEGRNPLTDPESILWQVRFVRCFVRCFREHPAVLAWDLGNECNCCGRTDRAQAWTWTHSIAGAIRGVDPGRPIVSGMHSLAADPDAAWNIHDQAELTDVLTTHPYPMWVPHCDRDPINTIKTLLHSTAETRLYGDVGGRPAMAEEIGTMGPMVASDAIAGDFTRACLYSLWAHDGRAMLWWCAFDQLSLGHAPYDWQACERELGMIREDGTPKPIAREMREFSEFLRSLPGDVFGQGLPPRVTEAVCVLTRGQDNWAAAYSSFILAKQAGFDVRFEHESQPLAEAPLYLLPSLKQPTLTRRKWAELLGRVRAGATLYLSLDDAIVSEFEAITGLEVQTRQRRPRTAQVTMDLGSTDMSFTAAVSSAYGLTLRPTRAQVLGREQDGNPAFTRAAYGKGQVYLLNFPIEHVLAATAGSFHLDTSVPWWRIYHAISRDVVRTRVIEKDHPMIGVTEHLVDRSRRVAVIVNYSPDRVAATLRLAEAWRVDEILRGSGLGSSRAGGQSTCDLPACDAAVWLLRR